MGDSFRKAALLARRFSFFPFLVESMFEEEENKTGQPKQVKSRTIFFCPLQGVLKPVGSLA